MLRYLTTLVNRCCWLNARFVVRKMTLEILPRQTRRHARSLDGNYPDARVRHLFAFTQRIVNAENTVRNEAEVLIVCVDPLLMEAACRPQSLLVAEFKQRLT